MNVLCVRVCLCVCVCFCLHIRTFLVAFTQPHIIDIVRTMQRPRHKHSNVSILFKFTVAFHFISFFFRFCFCFCFYLCFQRSMQTKRCNLYLPLFLFCCQHHIKVESILREHMRVCVCLCQIVTV